MDPIIIKIIEEISRELNIPKEKTSFIIRHFFDWQKDAFSKVKAKSFYWKHFGNFIVMPKRLSKAIDKQNKIKEQYRLKFKKDGKVKSTNKDEI